MKEELINKVLIKLSDGMDFMAGEVPDICKQLLRYETVGAWTTLVMCLISLVVLAGLNRYFWKRMTPKYLEERFCALLISSLVGIFPLVFIVVSIITLLQIAYAPKAYLFKVLMGSL